MATLRAKSRNALDDDQLAYITSKGERKLPINDEGHVRAALARLDQTTDDDNRPLSDVVKARVHAKIVAAAKRFGIDVANAATELPFSPMDDAITFSVAEDGSVTFDDWDDSMRFDGQPDMGDVHVPGPMNSGPRKRSPLLRKLVQNMRRLYGKQAAVTSEEFESAYRTALGHAGGKARSAADPPQPTDQGDWDEPCAACQKAGKQSPKCTCPSCQENDPDDCLCASLFDEDSGEDDKAMSERNVGGFVASETGEQFNIFLPVALAEAPDWIPYLPTPGTFKHPKYGALTFTKDRNARFVRNFRDAIYNQKLPIDIEHESKLSGAAGYINNLRQNTDGSVDAQVEWTDRGKKMLANDRFKYFSPEWYDRWQQPESEKVFQDVAIGGGITTRPWFKQKHLRPLIASEAGIQVFDEDATAVPPAQLNNNSKRSRPMGNSPDIADLKRQLAEQEKRAAEAGQKADAAKQAAEAKDVKPEIKKAAESEQALFEVRKELAEEKAVRIKEQITAAEETAKKAAEAQPEDEKKFAELQDQYKAATERIASLEADARRQSFREQAKDWTGDIEGHVSFNTCQGSPFSARRSRRRRRLRKTEGRISHSIRFDFARDLGSHLPLKAARFSA